MTWKLIQPRSTRGYDGESVAVSAKESRARISFNVRVHLLLNNSKRIEIMYDDETHRLFVFPSRHDSMGYSVSGTGNSRYTQFARPEGFPEMYSIRCPFAESKETVDGKAQTGILIALNGKGAK